MINCILDFDPGVDDAAALFAIKNAKNLKLLALSSVNGNVSIEHTTRNMQCLAKLLDINVPMGKGQEVPLVREPFFATVHGDDGIAGFRSMIESEDVNELTSENSVTMMHEIIQNSTKKITIIAVGPLTNIALLLRTFPEDKKKSNKSASWVAPSQEVTSQVSVNLIFLSIQKQRKSYLKAELKS